MLSFDQKLAILESFPELSRKDVSLGRVNYQYEGSLYDKKNVAFHLHPNGNGFVYAGSLSGYDTDDKGFVNIRDYDEAALRELVTESIRLLSVREPEPVAASKKASSSAAGVSKGKGNVSVWHGADKQTLTLKHEDDLWYVYAGPNLEMVLETYEEAEQYLHEEGFFLV
ncbi:hypothetical protein [Paenibacillus sacheonensis]|uniref:Uncharacterized protein n=1 Tax=Paenibacillus sacheonensis TaxID=742054 RepID=A0A7X5C106_9BACL|nr:hypothetical protein [Paenibacillus sacheonensis]MBM7568453.1 hypothetical protein [Paenibacillus sacheonensis]NBC72151.1 hypothetical protein [Paenibacillus sacheonensis]